MPRLYLIRHGETEANVEGRLLGSSESPLTARGREQASTLARELASTPISKIMSSPRQRAMDTAARLAGEKGLTVASDPRLTEIDFGAWELQKRTDLLASPDADHLLRWENEMVGPHGGEDLEAFRVRVSSFLESVQAESGPIAVVSHVYVIKQVLALALGVPFATMARTYLDPGTVTVVEWGKKPIVRVMNYHIGWSTARWLS